jgi:hypothetical protein
MSRGPNVGQGLPLSQNQADLLTAERLSQAWSKMTA